MYPHRIRLRGPWDCEPLARRVLRADGRFEIVLQSLPPKCRMTLPSRWSEGGLEDFAGRVRFRRRFGHPRQLDPHECVWLTFGGVEESAEVWLNENALGKHEGSDPFEFEVTALLQDRNELIVEVEAASGQGGLWGEVALEIRCAAFLRSVRLWATFEGELAKLHASGETAGECEGALELYIVLDRSTVAYATVEAKPGGWPFHLVTDDLSPGQWRMGGGGQGALHAVRIELVHGPVAWYSIEQLFRFECPKDEL